MPYILVSVIWSVIYQIDYFNNKIICDLVEAPKQGILAILDDACLNVGKTTDAMFLDAMSDKLKGHKHFQSRKVSVCFSLIYIDSVYFYLNLEVKTRQNYCLETLYGEFYG